MARQFWVCGFLMLALQVTVLGDEKGVSLPPAPTHPGLEKMKKLVGTWVATDQEGKPTEQVVSVIRLTAGGSAVHETLFPGQPHEMISIYTAEGPDLIMTHYCVLGNQPRMKLVSGGQSGDLVFDFAGGDNIEPDTTRHMHGGRFTVKDVDSYEADWILMSFGKPAGNNRFFMKRAR